MTGSTEFMLHSDDAFVDQKMLCVCDAGTGCEVLNGLKAENLKVRYDQNGEMLELTFADVEKVWDEKTHACVFATATPTVSAMADSVVTGAIWYESGEHKSGEFAFAFTLTGEPATKSAARPSTSGGLQVKSGSDSAHSKNGSAGYVMGQSPGAAQLTGIVTQRAPQFKSLPAYTETISDTTDYANYGGSNWEVEPMTVEATIGPREKYTVALATSYWANADTSGYGAEPTQLVATFTSGDGMLDFYVTIGAGPIWGGAECEMLTIVPTDAAYTLTADTTVTGTIDIYWRGYCHMPFSVTIDVEEQVAKEPKTEVICDSTAACGDDWSWTGDGDKIASLPAGEITADEIFVAAVCTPYWTDNHYTTEATETTVTFTSGAGLVTIALRNRQESVIWGGADCVFAEITPTETAEEIKEDTVVSGTFQMFYAPWGAYCEVPFEIVLKADVQNVEPDLPEYTETVSDSTDYANFGGSSWEVEPMTVETTIGPREKFSVALATSYWANPEASGYGAEPTKLNATFANGEGLLDFYVTIAAGPIWGGAECEMLTIVPTDAAYALTADTTITGTIEIYWRGWVQMPFSVTIDVPIEEGGETPEEPVAKTEVISDSTDACGDDWSWSGDGDKIAALPTGEITVEQIFVAAVCTPYWTDNYYTTEATPTTVTFTSGEGLVTIALRNRQESVIWGGADCVFAEVTPTAAGEAITEATTVSGTFQMFYAPWGAYCEVPFEIVLEPVGSEGGEGGETPEEPVARTEVISDSTDACGDDWSWSGEGDKIATLPYGEISVEETYVAAICSPYWTDNKYGTATAVNVTFTSGEGLVSIALHNRQESVIWGGAECVFAEITPTEAAANISRDMKVSGTFQMFYASWGSYCEVPFEILLKPAAGVETIDWTVADAWYQRAEEIISFADPKPLTHSFKIKDKTDGIKTLLHSSYHFTLCNCGDEDCDLTENVTNLKVRLDQGKDMVTFQFEKIYYSDWGQDCTFMTITPTDAAKQAVRNGDITLTGAFYYEGGEHRSGDYVFNFTFTNGNLAPGEKEQRYLFDMPDQVNEAINSVIGGMSPELLHWVIEEDGIYRGLFMRTTMRPFVPCTTCGMNCSEISNAGAANLKVKVTKNSHLADFSVEIAQYDGAAWGDCFYVTLTPTDAAVGVAPGTTIEGEFYLEVNGHKTSGFPFRYSFSVEEALPDKPEEIGTMADQVDAVLNILRTGGELKPIFAALQHDKSYRGLLMRQPMLPFVPCEIDDVYCQYTPNFTADNLKVKVNTNADLATFSVELAQYHGSAWGPCFYLNIRLTEAAKNAPKGTAITGEIYFEGDGHKTKAIPFAFFVEEVDGSKLTSTTVEAANNSELKKIEGMVDLVDAYVRETVEGKTPAPVSVVVDPNYEYVGMVMTKGLIPYVLCEKDGDKCAENANLGAEHMQVNFAENGNLIKDVRFEMANYDGWGDCVYMFVSFTDEAKQADPMTAIRGTLSFQKDGHKTKDIQLDMYLFDMPEDLKPQDAPEEQPTEDVQQPTQEQQDQPGSNVGTNDPIDTVDDNGGDNLVLILVLCAAGLVLALALIVLLILVKKKNQK